MGVIASANAFRKLKTYKIEKTTMPIMKAHLCAGAAFGHRGRPGNGQQGKA
jgi:hypothetical protein